MSNTSEPVWKDPDIGMVRQLLAMARPVGAPAQSWEERRMGMDAFGLRPLAEGTVRVGIDIDGLHSERLTPPGADESKALLYLHGGGYCIGSPLSHGVMVSRFAAVMGVPAIVPNYRLGPEHPFPAAVDDALKAYRHLLEGVAPEGIAIAGDSAGGGLTLALALAIRDAGLPQPGCLFVISPWADLRQVGPAYAALEPVDAMLSKAGLDEFAAAYLNGHDPADPLASPALGDYTGLAPLLIHVGGAEVLLSDACAVAEKAGLAGVDVRLEIWPEMIHVWHAFADQMATSWRAINEAGAWMKAKTG